MSIWYRREEALRRFSIFFNSVTLAGAFGGLLASAIQDMNGTRGYSGWRWIFILEGLLTAVLALISFFLIPDFPEDVKWLTAEEKLYMQERLLSRHDGGQDLTLLGGLSSYFKNYKAYLGGLLYFGKLPWSPCGT